MTTPLKTVRNLDTLATGYTIFEKDQVLTANQLNGITDYLDDQNRLTRIGLLGSGLMAGFDVQLSGDMIVVSQGAGITTDGDLLALQTDITFDRYRVYDEKAPFYPPFYPEANDVAPGKMMQIFELIRAGEKDASASQLSSLPVKLADWVAVLYLESYRNDPDLCSGTDCDNLGQQAINIQRLLLVSRGDAASLLHAPDTLSAASLKLPELTAERPLIGALVSSTDALAEIYRKACDSTHEELANNLGSLFKLIPGLVRPPFSADPSADWIATLNTRRAQFAKLGMGIQHYYDFLKDIVETWNALRDVLFEDDGVLWPDFNAFPKHLLLGCLSSPAELRSDWHPAPLTRQGVHDHAHFLVLKLHTLINSFKMPNESEIIVTPSNDESVPLEERAIPYYYALNGDNPIHLSWNHRMTRRGTAARNHGYRAAEYGDKRNPLTSQIGRYDFFRIEGHLGQNVVEAQKKLEQTLGDYNLPFTVRAVLLHTERKHIVIRPPMRFGDLHRIHHILRKDMTMQLEDAKQFNDSFKQGIDHAIANKQITDQNVSATANARHGEIADAVGEAALPLAVNRYSDYQQARQTKDWRGAYKTVINSAGNFKGTLGEIVRTDITTVFDTLVTNRQPDWLGWMDILIKAKDDREDDKLLFPAFVRQHPGLDHAGGVPRGGTFVLVYDDQANVVADFALSYNWPETAESEPEEETALPNPDFRLPGLRDDIFKLRPTLEDRFKFKLDEFEAKLQPKWMEQINIQKEHMTFFKESVGALTNLLGNKTRESEVTANFADKMLEYNINDVQTKAAQVENLRQMVMNQQLTGAARELADKKLLEMQSALAESIAESAGYVVENKIDLTATADGGRALGSLTHSMGMVTDNTARTRLGTKLNEIRGGASDTQATALVGLIKVGGFGIR